MIILWYVAVAIFYSTLFRRRCSFNNCKQWMQATVFTNLSLYAEQTISKWLQIYFMKHIHNQWKGLEDTKRCRKLICCCSLACGWVSWIQLTLQKLLLPPSLFLLLWFYLFINVRLLENNKKQKTLFRHPKKRLFSSRTKRWHGKIIRKSERSLADKKKMHWKVHFV